MTEQAQKRVLRPPAAAAYTGLSESTLAKRRLYGQPPAFLSLGGRAIGYAIDELDRWLELVPTAIDDETCIEPIGEPPLA